MGPARALKEVGIGFILVGSGSIFSLLIACVFTSPLVDPLLTPSCINSSQQSQRGQNQNARMRITILMQALGIDSPRIVQYEEGGRYIFWLSFGFWLALFSLLMLNRRALNTFTHPDADVEEEDDGHSYQPVSNTTPSPAPIDIRQLRRHGATISRHQQTIYYINQCQHHLDLDCSAYRQPSPAADSSANRTSAYSTTPTTSTSYPASRPSMDAYGAFSDPAPKWIWRRIDDICTPSVGPGCASGEQDDAVCGRICSRVGVAGDESGSFANL